MASLEDIGKLLDEKLAPLQNTVGSLVSTVGSLVETNMRKEAKNMFGVSFAKPFLIRSLHDAVHLVTKAKFKGLTPDAVGKRFQAADFEEADGYGDTSAAKKAYDEGDYGKGLGLLIGEAKKNGDSVPGNVVFYLERLKKAFSAKNEDGSCVVESSSLLTCDGPGVMLLELSSKYTTADLVTKSNIFDKGELHEEIENDLRGSMDLVGDHATITCGEIKSSFAAVSKAKEQLRVRTHFLKKAVETIFPGQIQNFILVGHLFVPKQAAKGKTRLPANEVLDDVEGGQVSIYIHML